MLKLQCACFTIIIFIAIIYLSVRRRKTYNHSLFKGLLVASIINLIFDMAAVITVNRLDTVPLFFNRLIHDIFIGTLVIILFITFCYILSLIEIPVNHFWYIPLVVSLLGVIAMPLDYMETPQGNYSYGPAAYMAYFSVGFYLLISITLLLFNWKRINNKKRFVILIALASQLVITLYQAFQPLSLISSLGATLLNLSFYLTVESPDIHLIEQLEEEKESANAANEAKSIFLASMSHEIRTPINAVMGMNEMILRDCKDEGIREYALEIKDSSEMLYHIINDILDFTKIESGKLEIIEVTYDIRDLLYDVVNMMCLKAKEKGIEFHIQICESLPTKLFGDDIRLRQILTNLLTNAVKYTSVGSVLLTIDCEQKGENSILKFEVRDTGIGIKQEDITRLLVAFERMDSIRNRNIEGTGLGLNIVDRLLKLMNSRLYIDSEYGEGSVFMFSIEQRVISEQTIGNFEEQLKTHKEHQEYTPSFCAPNAKILLVEDNPLNRRVFRALLKDTLVDIDEAQDGYECLERVKSKYYNMIFLDHMMPGLDGIETLKQMKQMENNLCYDTPVVMLTANAIVGAKEKYLEQGFREFISKPIIPQQLEKVIKKHVNCDTINQSKTEDHSIVFPEIDGVDWDYAKAFFPYEELLHATSFEFAKSLKEEVVILDKYFHGIQDEMICDKYIIKIHSIKSLARNVGAIRISELAELIELHAKEAEFVTIRVMHPYLIKDLNEYRDRVLTY